MLETLGKHPNIVGVKLTCGGIAKVARVRNRFEPEQFSALAGQSDWLTPALAVGGTGVITGIANLFPKVITRVPESILWRMCADTLTSSVVLRSTTFTSLERPKRLSKPS